MKKPLNQLIYEVIVPIENNKVDDRKLYVSLKAEPESPTLSLTRKSFIPPKTIIDEGSLSSWGIENEIYPGKWIIKDRNEFKGGSVSIRLPLFTLSTLLFCNKLNLSIFVTEYEGEFEPLRIGQLYARFATSEDEIIPNYLERIYNCLPKSLNVLKARITQKITTWNYIRYWEFALLCVERALGIAQENINASGYKFPNIFLEAFAYAKADYESKCFQNKAELIKIKEKYAENINGGFLEKDAAAKNTFYSEMSQLAKENYHLPYGFLREAIMECIDFYTPFRRDIFGHARAVIGYFNQEPYRNEYIFPNFLEQPDDLRRIEYAFRKKELDWQTENLIKFIED